MFHLLFLGRGIIDKKKRKRKKKGVKTQGNVCNVGSGQLSKATRLFLNNCSAPKPQSPPSSSIFSLRLLSHGENLTASHI